MVVRLFLDEWHYVMLNGCKDGQIWMFDPYYCDEPFPEAPEVQVILDAPVSHNRIVPEKLFNRETLELYSLGPEEGREAVLLTNKNTVLTTEKTIEYFI